MPVHSVAGGGEQWGRHGKVYHGPDAKQKAQAQGRAAYANGYRGDEAGACAGVLFRGPGNRFLLLKRDDRDEWESPGGHIEEGEDAVTAAMRETREEIGLKTAPGLRKLGENADHGVSYTTFLQNVPQIFTPRLNEEHTDYRWASLDELPDTTHPGVRKHIEILGASLTELDIAKSIRAGDLSSPQRYENLWLFDVRITGTGASYRSAHDEYVWRDPEIFLSDDFLERCAGLPLIFEHPTEGTLNTDEWRSRMVGIVVLPYIKGDEVWGIAKVYDEDAAQLMESGEISSTSPAVVFREAGSTETADYNGKSVLIEGKPSYLDHLAICQVGVWDKGGEPSGINYGDHKMADEDKKQDEQRDQVPAWADALIQRMDSVVARMDSMEEAKKAEEKAEKEGEEESKDEEKASEAGEREKKAEEKAVRDDKDEDRDAKGEFDSEDEDKEEKKADSNEGAEEAEKAAEGLERKDSQMRAENAALKTQLAALESRLTSLTQPLSHEDRDALAAAQSRADATYQLVGSRASAPLMGENPIAYRKRLAAGLQKYSKQFKEVALDSLDGPIFETVEQSIYSDAETASRAADSTTVGRLMPQVRKDSAGREITTFHGDMNAWLTPFKSAGRSVSFNRDEIRRSQVGV